MLENFIEIYEYLIQRVNSNPMYGMKRTMQNYKQISNFLERSNIQTAETLWQYLLFQVVLCDNQRKNKYFSTLSNFVSKNALERWKNRTDEMMFLVSKFQRERGLRNPLVKDSHEFSEEYKDLQRNKFFNTARGFIFCGEFNGLLYDKVKCFRCRYKHACKSALTY